MPKHALPLADSRSDTETNRAATFSPKPQFSQSRKRGIAISIGDRHWPGAFSCELSVLMKMRVTSPLAHFEWLLV
jgi:hypothetical protein